MDIYFLEADGIYFSKTKEYFKEIVSSYINGNYRSATVMLYSVAICDILFKLQELKDMYNDSVATRILQKIEKEKAESESKSHWEKTLLDFVKRETQLLDVKAYSDLHHLFDDRNLSAHPALNQNFELISPSKEATLAHIKNMLNEIFVKPPIFIKDVVNMLTVDLSEKKEIYTSQKDLKIYLNNKYFNRMNISMKKKVFKAFWKFCFKMPDNADCDENIVINKRTLILLTEQIKSEIIEMIKTEPQYFDVAVNEGCVAALISFLANVRDAYENLNDNCKLLIDREIEKRDRAKAIAWFKYKTLKDHVDYLTKQANFDLSAEGIQQLTEYYCEQGEINLLLDFLIDFFGRSKNFDTANIRYQYAIAPYLKYMGKENFLSLLNVINENSQIYNRGASYSSNTNIIREAKKFLDSDFDYTRYCNIDFDKSILTDSFVELTEIDDCF